jgi:hypothetical protein
MQFVTDHFRLWIDDDVDVARAQPAPPPKEAERKTSGQLKPVDQHVPALRKQLFDALFRRRVCGT